MSSNKSIEEIMHLTEEALNSYINSISIPKRLSFISEYLYYKREEGVYDYSKSVGCLFPAGILRSAQYLRFEDFLGHSSSSPAISAMIMVEFIFKGLGRTRQWQSKGGRYYCCLPTADKDYSSTEMYFFSRGYK